jgi:hypothetical protein
MWTPALIRELRDGCGGTRLGMTAFCGNLMIALYWGRDTIQQTGESVRRMKYLRQCKLADATVADEISVDLRPASILT